MREKTLYTSVGRFERRMNADGIAYPVILLGGKEYLLDVQEAILWTCLNWRLLRRQEIHGYYDEWSRGRTLPFNRSLDACVNRLVTRGLLIEGTGETEYDALYDLLSSMYIVPIGGNFFLRLVAACKVAIQLRKPVMTVKYLFKSQKCSSTEKTVLQLSRRIPLSTAEVIRCMEMGIQRVPNNEAVMDTIYADRDTTSDNIAALVKPADCTKDVIMAIANLYLRQQVVFDRV